MNLKLSDEQLHRAAHRLIAECIAEAGPHDVAAALDAADILADTLPDEEWRRLAGCRPPSDRVKMRRTLDTLDAALSQMDYRGAALSLLGRPL